MGIKEYERKIGYGEDGLKTIMEENLSKLTPSYEESYILDRTRAYHNLLQNKTIKRGSQAIQSYVWDFNVAYMEVGIASGNQKNINWKNVLVDTASGLAVGAIAGTKNKTVIFQMKN